MSMLLAAAASSGASPSPPVPGWLDDLLAASAPGACIAGNTFTTGIEFNALSNATIIGIRAHWGTGFAPQTVRCTLWYATGPNTGTAIAQEDVPNVVGGAIFQTSGAFTGHVMVSGEKYAVTISVPGISNTAAIGFRTSISGPLPCRPGKTNSRPSAATSLARITSTASATKGT